MFPQPSVILSRGGSCIHGGFCIWGGSASKGGLHCGGGESASWGVVRLGFGYYEIRSTSGRTHPTGMHSSATFFFSQRNHHGFCSEQMESCGIWFATNRLTIVPPSPPPFPSKKEPFGMKEIGTMFHQRVHLRPKVHSPTFFLIMMVFECGLKVTGFFHYCESQLCSRWFPSPR